MKINVNKALTAEAERKAKPVPIPTIRRKIQDVNSKTIAITLNNPGLSNVLNLDTNILLTQLECERHSLMLDRKKLSTRIASLLNEVHQRIKEKEGAAAATEFLNGNISSPELKEHYSKIQRFTDQLIALYDKIEYVKQNGQLPIVAENNPPSLLATEDKDVAAITWEIRRLDDLIYKLSKKLANANSGIKKPKNSERTNTWRSSMALAEAKRDDLKFKRKQLRHGGR